MIKCITQIIYIKILWLSDNSSIPHLLLLVSWCCYRWMHVHCLLLLTLYHWWVLIFLILRWCYHIYILLSWHHLMMLATIWRVLLLKMMTSRIVISLINWHVILLLLIQLPVWTHLLRPYLFSPICSSIHLILVDCLYLVQRSWWGRGHTTIAHSIWYIHILF